MNSAVSLLKDLFFPPHCIACKTRLLPGVRKGEKSVFCTPCATEFEKSMLAQCGECFSPFNECRCQPATMKRAGSAGLLKLVPYDAGEKHRCAAGCIRGMKYTPRQRTFSYFAEQLRVPLLKMVAELQEKQAISDTVVAYLPRARKRVRSLGFDQARELAIALSAATGYAFSPLLRRVRDGKPQKTLTERERRENIKGCFAVCGDVSGKRVILVDDLVTTGSGMAEAIRMLRREGAAEIVCACVGYTLKKSAKK